MPLSSSDATGRSKSSTFLLPSCIRRQISWRLRVCPSRSPPCIEQDLGRCRRHAYLSDLSTSKDKSQNMVKKRTRRGDVTDRGGHSRCEVVMLAMILFGLRRAAVYLPPTNFTSNTSNSTHPQPHFNSITTSRLHSVVFCARSEAWHHRHCRCSTETRSSHFQSLPYPRLQTLLSTSRILSIHLLRVS